MQYNFIFFKDAHSLPKNGGPIHDLCNQSETETALRLAWVFLYVHEHKI